MKKLLIASAASLSLLFSSCLGPNHLTNGLFNWNATVFEQDWAKELVFVGLTPIYVVTTVGDWAVLNTWHYWTGENLVPEPGPFPGFAR